MLHHLVVEDRTSGYVQPYLRAFTPKRTIGRIQKIPNPTKLRYHLRSLSERIRFDWVNPDPKIPVQLRLNRNQGMMLTIGGVDVNDFSIWVGSMSASDHRWSLDANDGIAGHTHEMHVDEIQPWSGFATQYPAGAPPYYIDKQGGKHNLEYWELGVPAASIDQEFTADLYPELFAALRGTGPLRVNAQLWTPDGYNPSNCWGHFSWASFQPQQFSGWVPAMRAEIDLELI